MAWPALPAGGVPGDATHTIPASFRGPRHRTCPGRVTDRDEKANVRWPDAPVPGSDRDHAWSTTIDKEYTADV